jgi:CIC family chloride channel protein
MSRLNDLLSSLPEHGFVQRLHWSKLNWHRQPGVWFIALGIGIIVGYAIIGFRFLIDIFSYLAFGASEATYLEAVSALSPLSILFWPTLGGLAVGLILKYWMQDPRSHGIADLIEARALHGGRLEIMTGLKSALVAAVSLGTGASTGREGPAAHLGASLASQFTKRFNYSPRIGRILLAAGAASAVAASFNAPIAGVIFALEVILGFYTARAFAPIVIASVAGALICRLHIGDMPAFSLPDHSLKSVLEVPAFAILGVVSGLSAVFFMRVSVVADTLNARIKLPIIARTTLGGLIIGVIALAFPEILGVGYGATDNALKGAYGFWFLIALFFAKVLATTVSLTARHGGGIFSPSLYLGAMVGGAFGIIVSMIFPGLASDPGFYAIIGMGAVSAAILGAPISTTLIVFELTGDYGIMIALMIATSISTVLTQAMFGRSLFHLMIERHGYHVADGPQKLLLETMQVSEVMTPNTATTDIEIQEGEVSLTPQDSLERTFQLFDETHNETIPVVERGLAAQVIGFVDHKHALEVFNKALIEANVEEHL